MPRHSSQLPLDLEDWQAVPDWEGWYEVSNLGQVRRVKTGRILKPGMGRAKYLVISLCRDSRKTTFLLHRLVAIAFWGQPGPRMEVNHRNGMKLDNRATNLEWVTRSENNRHAYSIGLRLPISEYKVHCRHGHPFTKDNTYRDPNGNRECRICRRLLWVAWARRKGIRRLGASIVAARTVI